MMPQERVGSSYLSNYGGPEPETFRLSGALAHLLRATASPGKKHGLKVKEWLQADERFDCIELNSEICRRGLFRQVRDQLPKITKEIGFNTPA
jgi:hypothetical protein